MGDVPVTTFSSEAWMVDAQGNRIGPGLTQLPQVVATPVRSEYVAYGLSI